jgi:hypothetical protein
LWLVLRSSFHRVLIALLEMDQNSLACAVDPSDECREHGTSVKGAREMTIFTIDPDNNITAFASAAEAKSKAEAERFRSAKELTKLAAKWPATRLIEIWNSLPGVSPVRKFTSRQTAVNRIWTAIQNLAPEDAPHTSRVATKRGRAAKDTSPTSATRVGSKTEIVLGLLKRPEGATMNELMATTEWQAHSVRGFLSGTLRKKMGLKIESNKSAERERTYSIQV